MAESLLIPTWLKVIASKGLLTAQKAADKSIARIYEQVRAAKTFPFVIDNNEDNELLGIAKIKGPGWFLITVYPNPSSSKYIQIISILHFLWVTIYRNYLIS